MIIAAASAMYDLVRFRRRPSCTQCCCSCDILLCAAGCAAMTTTNFLKRFAAAQASGTKLALIWFETKDTKYRGGDNYFVKANSV